MESKSDNECLTDVEEEVILHEIRKDRNPKNCNVGASTSKDVLRRYTVTKYHSENINNRHVFYTQLQNAIR